jgi:predicted nucleic acid-binding Zn ribbon protein
MPIYGCVCQGCGHYETIFRHISQRDDTPVHCSQKMVRRVEAPSVQVDIGGYTSPIDGKWIEGKSARREDLKRNNCRPWEGMESEKKEAKKRAAEADKTFEKGVEQAAYNVYNNMSAEKQRAIDNAA